MNLSFPLLSAWFWIGFFSTLILILFHPTYSLRLCPEILQTMTLDLTLSGPESLSLLDEFLPTEKNLERQTLIWPLPPDFLGILDRKRTLGSYFYQNKILHVNSQMPKFYVSFAWVAQKVNATCICQLLLKSHHDI